MLIRSAIFLYGPMEIGRSLISDNVLFHIRNPTAPRGQQYSVLSTTLGIEKNVCLVLPSWRSISPSVMNRGRRAVLSAPFYPRRPLMIPCVSFGYSWFGFVAHWDGRYSSRLQTRRPCPSKTYINPMNSYRLKIRRHFGGARIVCPRA